jgi:hypothetical protein
MLMVIQAANKIPAFMEPEISGLVPQKTPQMDPSLSQLNLFHVFKSSSLVICFSISLPSTFRTLEVVFSFQIILTHSCQTAECSTISTLLDFIT